MGSNDREEPAQSTATLEGMQKNSQAVEIAPGKHERAKLKYLPKLELDPKVQLVSVLVLKFLRTLAASSCEWLPSSETQSLPSDVAKL